MRIGRLWFSLLALLLVLILLVLRDRPWHLGGLTLPAVTDPEQTVPALLAEVSGADGSLLRARLTRLHADPERQAFERESLRRRLDLGPGEPWRLSLEWRSGEGADGTRPAGSARGRFTGSGPARGEPLPAPASSLGLGHVRVEDAEGLALGPLPAARPGETDPLRALLTPPGGSIAEGQALDWVLWGRQPGAEARLVGLLPPPGADGAEEFSAATGLAGALVFTPQEVLRRELLLPLARLDRGVREPTTRGKNGVPGSSEQP